MHQRVFRTVTPEKGWLRHLSLTVAGFIDLSKVQTVKSFSSLRFSWVVRGEPSGVPKVMGSAFQVFLSWTGALGHLALPVCRHGLRKTTKSPFDSCYQSEMNKFISSETKTSRFQMMK